MAVVCAFALTRWASESLAASVIHVATTGNDAADGSAERPLNSLPQAQHRARELRTKQPGEQVTIEVGAGTYVLKEPLVFTPEDSGASAERPLTIVGRGDIRISGGDRIDGFKPREGHWVASVPESVPPFRDLWVNGRRAIRARAPNDGYYRIAAAGTDKRTSFTAEPKDITPIANPTTAEVVYFHDWSISRVGVKSIDSDKHTYQLVGPIGANSPFFAICGFEQHPRYFVENAIELLDAPGEWFFDAAKRELHYMPREGETIEKLEAIAPRLSQLVVLRGTDQKSVENVRFEGLNFTNTAFDLPALGYAEVQANWYSRREDLAERTRVLPPAAVSSDRAKNCAFKNCRFEHLAAAGLHIAHSVNVRAERSTFSDLGGNGIMIGSPMNEENPPAEGNVVGRGLVSFKHQFNESTSFENVSLIETGSNNTFLQNDAGIAVSMSEKLALKLGYQVRHNTDVNPGKEKTDQLITTNLVFKY